MPTTSNLPSAVSVTVPSLFFSSSSFLLESPGGVVLGGRYPPLPPPYTGPGETPPFPPLGPEELPPTEGWIGVRPPPDVPPIGPIGPYTWPYTGLVVGVVERVALARV